MHLWIIQSVFTIHRAAPCSNRSRDCVTRPGSCMAADGLFMGEATLRKIFCLQETLRGVGGRPPLTESLLQPDRVLFLPSPLLREKTSASQTPDEWVRYHLMLPRRSFSSFYKSTHTLTQETNLKHTDKKIYVPGVDPMLIKQKVCASATQTQLMGVHVCFLEKEACQRRRKLTVHRLVLLMFHIHPVIITSRPWGFSHLPTQNNADNVANPTRSKPKTRRSVTWWGFCEVRLSTASARNESAAWPLLSLIHRHWLCRTT